MDSDVAIKALCVKVDPLHEEFRSNKLYEDRVTPIKDCEWFIEVPCADSLRHISELHDKYIKKAEISLPRALLGIKARPVEMGAVLDRVLCRGSCPRRRENFQLRWCYPTRTISIKTRLKEGCRCRALRGNVRRAGRWWNWTWLDPSQTPGWLWRFALHVQTASSSTAAGDP